MAPNYWTSTSGPTKTEDDPCISVQNWYLSFFGATVIYTYFVASGGGSFTPQLAVLGLNSLGWKRNSTLTPQCHGLLKCSWNEPTVESFMFANAIVEERTKKKSLGYFKPQVVLSKIGCQNLPTNFRIKAHLYSRSHWDFCPAFWSRKLWTKLSDDLLRTL